MGLKRWEFGKKYRFIPDQDAGNERCMTSP
jgi:hypothetical protein